MTVEPGQGRSGGSREGATRSREGDRAAASDVGTSEELQAQLKGLREELRACKKQLKQQHSGKSAAAAASGAEPWRALATEHGSDLFFHLDKDGKVLQLGAAAALFTGAASEDAAGRPFADLLQDKDRDRWTAYLSAARNGNQAPLPVTFAGNGVAAEVRCLPIGEGSGAALEWVGLARRKGGGQSEEAKLAAGLAHELNQPLTAIGTTARACARLMQTDQADEVEVAEAIDQIARQAERGIEIVRRLRDLATQGRRHRARTDLNELVRESAQLLAADLKHTRVRLRLDLDPELPVVTADAIQIGQVIVNLLRNACDALLETAVTQRAITVTTTHDERSVTITVSDRGPGLALAITGRLFEPLVSTKPQGMGMGLALSRHIIQSHGGVIIARNNPDRGACVSFTLPLPPEKP